MQLANVQPPNWLGLRRLAHSENDNGDRSEQNSSAADPQARSSHV
jgi:hypothetical protein